MKRSKLLAISACCLTLSPAFSSAANDTEERLSDLEYEMTELNKVISTMKNKLRINGFLTAGLSYNSEPVPLNYFETRDELDFSSRSNLGMQFEFQISDNASATAQLLSSGLGGWEIDTSWAYITYNVTNNLTTRFGRMQSPLFMYSNVIDVGYAYTWAAPPAEVYGVGTIVKNFDGIDLSYLIEAGSVQHMISVFYGGSKLPGGGGSGLQALPFEVTDQFGLTLSSMWGNFSTWAGITNLNFQTPSSSAKAELEGINTALAALGVTNGFNLEDNPIFYWSFGAGYNNGSLIIDGEYIGYSFDEESLLADMEAKYLSIAYRFNKFTPYLVWSQNETTNEDNIQQGIQEIMSSPVAGSFPADQIALLAGTIQSQIREQTSIALGATYALEPRITLKAEIKESSDLNGTVGEYLPEAALTKPGFDGSTIYTTSINVVF